MIWSEFVGGGGDDGFVVGEFLDDCVLDDGFRIDTDRDRPLLRTILFILWLS